MYVLMLLFCNVHVAYLQTQLRPPPAATVKTVKLTLIYGNMCRRGPTPSEHKWKMIFETDGDQEAINCVKVTNKH